MNHGEQMAMAERGRRIRELEAAVREAAQQLGSVDMGIPFVVDFDTYKCTGKAFKILLDVLNPQPKEPR